ncbi:hypothetical protein BRPE64_BCDS08610 [Caballeronia insecticola]|uniref:Uncharacterized protein n=1 Tax=Caballeronia insecticola TaxID=758793 RepID=R4X2B5_9BURK|nr:hypothetical protein BRPE64_BCDS08610 [Caballeronia insecticola]
MPIRVRTSNDASRDDFTCHRIYTICDISSKSSERNDRVFTRENPFRKRMKGTVRVFLRAKKSPAETGLPGDERGETWQSATRSLFIDES